MPAFFDQGFMVRDGAASGGHSAPRDKIDAAYVLGHARCGQRTHLIDPAAGTDKVSLCGRLVHPGGSGYLLFAPTVATCTQCVRVAFASEDSARGEAGLALLADRLEGMDR